jgi:hypothetical protein
MTLQPAYLAQELERSIDDRQITDTVFLDVTKAFDTALVGGLLYKLAVLNFPHYLFKTLSSHLDCKTFKTSF